MLGFIKKYFFTAISFFSYNVLNVNYLTLFDMGVRDIFIPPLSFFDISQEIEML